MTTHKPRVAVVYATAQGSTRDIALFIADELTQRGADVEVSDAEHAPDPTRFDAVVLGSAVHNRRLLPEAENYIRNYRAELSATPVWLFSVGIGPALVGPIGRWFGNRVPPRIAALRDLIGADAYQPFAGHYERAGVDLGARTVYRLMGGTRYGDLRDWSRIRRWSTAVGDTLGLPAASNAWVHP